VKLRKEVSLDLLKKMIQIRTFEETMQDMYARGEAIGIIHLSIGQEAIAVGTCANLDKEDFIVSNHRGHHHAIAKGGNIKYITAELFGRKTGYCRGKGGSMHLASAEIGHLGSMGIVGSGIPVAIGAGLAIKLKQANKVVVCFFGDGASNQGFFHEGLNFASLHKLPVVFVCENNKYAYTTPQYRHQPIVDIALRASSYAMPGSVVDGNNVTDVYEVVSKAVKRARTGEGPTLIECKTYRLRGHHEGDPSRGIRYRTKEELQEWESKDPINSFCERLLAMNAINDIEIDKLRKDAESLVEEAVKFARESPYPEPADIFRDLYMNELVE
jgi:acetoin:2,6-dichlorophenolindophenol oxidoreductase subunit alpha